MMDFKFLFRKYKKVNQDKIKDNNNNNSHPNSNNNNSNSSNNIINIMDNSLIKLR